MQQSLVRHCPQCNTDRSPTETFCENELDGNSCGWPLSSESLVLQTIGDQQDSKATEEKDPTLESNLEEEQCTDSIFCSNGHEMVEGDILCLECNSTIAEDKDDKEVATCIGEWKLVRRLSDENSRIERYIAEKSENHDNKRYIVNIFDSELEPDESIYPLLQKLRSPHVSLFVTSGRSEGRYFQVWEEAFEESLADYISRDEYQSIDIRELVEQIGLTLNELGDLGIRHRELQPCNILVSSDTPKKFQITGFCSVIHSQLDFAEIICPTVITRYTAPECIVGGISMASDWWSFGAILLEIATNGRVFENVNEQAFRISVVTRGIEVPKSVQSDLGTLLRGFLTRDTSKRWQWEQTQKWLKNEIQSQADSIPTEQITITGASIQLANRGFHSKDSFALAAAEASNWEEALSLLSRGSLTTWLSEIHSDEQLIATVRSISLDESLSDDQKLAFCLLTLNQNLPLSLRGEIVNPSWLLSNPAAGYELITGSRAERLRQLGREPLLLSLAERVASVRKRIETLAIPVDEDRLRESLLATSRRNLENAWARVRAIFPDSAHAGIEGLLQRRTPSEEDYIILLSTPVEQLIPASLIVEKTAALAAKTSWRQFDLEAAKQTLSLPRATLYERLDLLLEGFARCEVEPLDDWADSYRMERRITLERALILLSVPKDNWSRPAKQQYVNNILGFFEKKILAKVNRGPLVRQSVTKSSTAIDLTEVGTARKTSQHIVDHILERSGQTIEIDPSVLDENPQLATRISSLIKKTRMFSRDTGRHGLFLGFPYLIYQSSNADGTTSFRAAPLMLWPVKVEASSSGRGRVKLASETHREEIRLNPALEGMLGSNITQLEKWKRCADEIIQRSSIRHRDVLDSFAQVATIPERSLHKLPGKDVETSHPRYIASSAVLFNCDFSGKSIADDLRFLKERPMEGTALERILKVSAEQSISTSSNSSTSSSDNHAIMDLDPSQSEAIFKANNDLGLHVEGPPGTGKSQTIVNIIADSVARGQTVLVVCQKQAALNIVEKRLRAHGLENRLFFINDVQKDREPLLKAFRNQIENKPQRQKNLNYLRHEHAKLVKRIGVLDQEINSHHEAVFAVHEAIGLNYREVIAQLIASESLGNCVSVPELRRIFAPTNDIIFSDGDISELEDACAGVINLWLDAHYEGSPLMVLKPFSWDRSSEDRVVKSFITYFDREGARYEVLKAYSESEDVEDIGPLQNWLDQHQDHLSNFTDQQWLKIRGWISLFPVDDTEEATGNNLLLKLKEFSNRIDECNKNWYHEKISSALIELPENEVDSWISIGKQANKKEDESNSSDKKICRWNILRFLHNKSIKLEAASSESEIEQTYRQYWDAEIERLAITKETNGCFDTQDGHELANWLEKNRDLKELDSATRENLQRWYQLFEINSKQASEGSLIIESLEQSLGLLEKLSLSHHSDTLFAKLKNLSSDLLSNYVSISRQAVECNSPFKNERDLRLEARWNIVRFLVKSGIKDLGTAGNNLLPGLKEALETFIRSEETRVKCIQENREVFLIDDATALQGWLSVNKDLLLGLSDQDRATLADWIPLFSGNDKEAAVGNKLLQDLEDLQTQLTALDHSHHSEHFYLFIAEMHPSTIADWTNTAKKVTSGSALNPVTHLSKWKLSKFLQRTGISLTTPIAMEFLQAAELECSLALLRSRYAGILRQLHLKVSDAANFNIHELENAVHNQFGLLRRIQQAAMAVLSCPEKGPISLVVSAKTRIAFEKFVENASVSIALYEARTASLSALKVLTEWFDEKWLGTFNDLINSVENGLTDLRVIWDGVGLFNDQSIEIFANAVILESDLAAIRAAVERAANKLQEPSGEVKQANLNELPVLAGALLKKLCVVRDLSQRINDCPCSRADKKFIDDLGAESFAEFTKQATGAIQRFFAREKSRKTLNQLSRWFGDGWIDSARKDIENNEVNLQELEDLSVRVKMYSDSTFEAFISAAELEGQIKQTRSEFNLAAAALNEAFDLTEQNVFTLEQQVANLAVDLEFVAKAMLTINSCPEKVQARRLLSKESKEHFSKFWYCCKGVLRRFETKNACRESLSELEEWFEPEWIETQRVSLESNRVIWPNIEPIKNSLHTLSSFQQFRLKVKLLDKRCLAILALCDKRRAEFAKVSRDELRNTIKATVRKEACVEWKSALENGNSVLLLEADELEHRIKSLSEATSALTQMNKELLSNPDWSVGISSSADEWNGITRLRGQRMIRLREFVEKGNELGLLKIRPIWLMNPEVASRLLPLQKGFFDKVIFDEASQLLVEYAVPAMYRAKIAIVSGDEKQMPPSDFFAAKVSADDKDDEYSDEDEDQLTQSERDDLEEKWNKREIKDCPDLLTLAASVLPSSKLEIHYRSEYRELIAFSNAAFYAGTLNIPSKHSPDEIKKLKPIEVVRVNSVYKKQTNLGEAEKVVEVLKNLWKQSPRPSVGVVTFNLLQSELIEDLLAVEAENDKDFAQIRQEEDLREEDGEDMAFFVKNLENVQGDERDIIIFSTTFGRNEKGVFKRFFGKVGTSGGDRRLNVAITRAKRKVVMVTSLPIDEISDSVQNNRQPRNGREYLHYYLEYASRISDGNLEQADALLEKLCRKSEASQQRNSKDGFIEDVQQFVERLGYDVAYGNDDHGAFSLDLAVIDPKSGLYGIGLECDAPQHHLLTRAYHREVWRQSVLTRAVKAVHRISSRQWYLDPQRQQKLLARAIHESMT